MSLKGLLCSSAFMMSFAVIISLITNFTGIFPGDVLDASLRSNITIFCLAVMLTLSFSRIPYNDLNPIKHSSSVIRAIILGLVVASVVPLAGYFILAGTEWADYAKGLVFIAATPFAASVGPLSYILRGDFEHALRSTVIIYILALAWIPFIIWICLGESVDMMNVLITVLEIIGLPL
ncbi:MAG: Na+-dependent transporter, partial [Candidatus Methanomethylophilaceae archaeon]